MRENAKTMRKWSLTQEKVDHHIMMREWTTKTNMMIVEQKGGRVTGWGHFPWWLPYFMQPCISVHCVNCTVHCAMYTLIAESAYPCVYT